MNNCNMNTNCKAWFYSPDGSYYLGPVDEQKMKTLIQEGTVTRNHLVWNSSMNGWEKIENTVLAIFFGSISGFASASSNAIGDESSIEEENEGGEDFQNQSGPSWDSALTKNIKTAKLINRLEKRSKNENDDYNLVEKFKKHARSLQDQNNDENPETIDNDLAEKFEQIEIYKKQFFSEKNYSNPDSSNNPEIASDIHDDIPEVPDDIPDVPDDIPDVPDDIPDESEDTDCDDTISEDDDDGILGNVFDFLSE